MGAVFVDWLNANEQRNYPLHDLADRKAKSGIVMPNDILVDAHIWLPKTAGRKIFVSSLGISPSLITLTFVAAPSDPFCGTAVPPFEFTPLGVVRVLRPHSLYRNHQIEAIYPGVGGWVALGACDDKDGTYSLVFEGPANTVLLDRTVHAFNDIPVLSVGKVGVLPKLTGTVRLQGVEGQIKTFAADKIIDGVTHRVAAIGLDKDPLQNNLAKFAGECGNRPEADNCKLAPLIEINGVKPDCDGNIKVKFEGDVIVGALQPGGLILDHPVGLAQVCNARPGFNELPGEDHSEYCDFPRPESSSSSTPSESSSSESEISSSSGPDVPEECEYFGGPVGPFTTYNQYTVFRPAPPSAPFEWSIELVGGSYQAATPLGYSGAQYMLNLEKFMTLQPGMLRHLSARVKPLSQQQNALVLMGHTGTDLGFYFFGLSLVKTALYPNGKFFFGKRGTDVELTDPDFSLGYGYVFNPEAEPVGKIWDPGADMPITEYYIRLRLSRSGSFTVIEAWVDWVNDDGAQSFYTTIPAFVPQRIEGYGGFGAVSSDTLYNAVGLDCIV